MDKPSYVGFKSNEYHWKPDIDYKENPHLYKVGRGQQGVLICQPYKSELHIHWRFKTPSDALVSSTIILHMYHMYKDVEDFVGMDMCRKFLEMGFTRSRRYANHHSGKKYDSEGNVRPQETDHATCHFAKSAQIFKKVRDLVAKNATYVTMRKTWRNNE